MSAADVIREACLSAKRQGIVLHRGPWFEFRDGRVVSCCAIGAVLLASGVDVKPPTGAEPRGHVRAACEALGVNGRWLYRFWMGFDRGFQIMIESEDTLTKDDVSGLGIQIALEFT